MSTITIEIDREHSRRVVVQHLARTLVISKQYIHPNVMEAYKTVLSDIATLYEGEAIQQQFDKAWPTDVKWNKE